MVNQVRFALGASALSCLLLLGCRKKHVTVAQLEAIPYPSCEGAQDAAAAVRVLGEGALRPGETSLERMVTERFRFEARACLRVMTVRQEWPLNVSDVEVVYDAAMLPLRAWKRMSLPGAPNAAALVDIRRYELRTPEVGITRRVGSGPRQYERLRGGRPTVVIGPGRGILTAWIQRANLDVGARTRELALDMRESVEVIRPVTLRREPDMFVAALGRVARVYTVYGRESVYADAQNVVIGDLAGMLPEDRVHSPRPPAMPSPEPPDPVATP
ncbi:MAG: hypothetical protein JNK72_00125 [Myxococcales bacterium]|nr:hypothetical protein [Myxococcales bacterium]